MRGSEEVLSIDVEPHVRKDRDELRGDGHLRTVVVTDDTLSAVSRAVGA
jgi:hypothetical protein